MKDEEKARQETEAGQAGEETCSLQRGIKESVGSGEEVTQEMIEEGMWWLFRYNPDGKGLDAEQAVKQIYLQMIRLRKNCS